MIPSEGKILSIVSPSVNDVINMCDSDYDSFEI